MPQADHGDTYKQLALKSEDEQTAAVGLRNPVAGAFSGFIRRTQRFGATAPALRYNSFPRPMASLKRRILKMMWNQISSDSRRGDSNPFYRIKRSAQRAAVSAEIRIRAHYRVSGSASSFPRVGWRRFRAFARLPFHGRSECRRLRSRTPWCFGSVCAGLCDNAVT